MIEAKDIIQEQYSISPITGNEISSKQEDFLENSYHKINIASGAIQAGKSYILNERFGKYVIFESPHSKFHITGNTIDTIDRNVINNNDYGLKQICEEILGERNVNYHYGQDLIIELPNGEEKTCYIIGVNDAKATKRLKGSPAGGTLADELTTYPEEPGNMVFVRNSLENSILFGSTNPDSPNHWVYKNFIISKVKHDLNLVKTWFFTLDDNPTMSETEKIAYHNLYDGIFYQRNILGKWVLTQGAIYNMFVNEHNKNMVKIVPKIKFDDAFIAVDYGTGNVTTALLFFVKWNPGKGNHYYYCHDEFYYDVKDEKNNDVRLLDSEIVEKIYELYYPYNNIINNIFVDPSAISLIEELTKFEVLDLNSRSYYKPFNNTLPAYNSVLEGISKVTTLLKHRFLQFNENCVNSIREHQGYMWDSKRDNTPIKKDDHTCDTTRYGIMSYLKLLNDPGNQGDAFTIGSAGVNVNESLHKRYSRIL